MTLKDELNIVLEELEDEGIKYPNKIYCRVKMIMTSIDGIENMFLGGKR